MAITYPFSAIADAEVPRATDPAFQHILDTYAGETNKTVTTWLNFVDQPLDFKPHSKSSSVGEIMKHQLLSERRFFGEFLSTPEPDARLVLPMESGASAYAKRLVALARPRLAHLATRDLVWWLQPAPFFDVERQRIWIFWRRVLHSAHHRTQLTVYERLLEQPVLPTYGPTADITWEGADPTLTVEAASRA